MTSIVIKNIKIVKDNDLGSKSATKAQIKIIAKHIESFLLSEDTIDALIDEGLFMDDWKTTISK